MIEIDVETVQYHKIYAQMATVLAGRTMHGRMNAWRRLRETNDGGGSGGGDADAHDDSNRASAPAVLSIWRVCVCLVWSCFISRDVCVCVFCGRQ